jgi:hypothetical protein
MTETSLNASGFIDFQKLLDILDKVESPSFPNPAAFDKYQMKDYLKEVAGRCNLNEQYVEGLLDHCLVMEGYFRALLRYKGVSDFVKGVAGVATEDEAGKFLEILVYLHDFGRFFFHGGSLPLTENDHLSSQLLDQALPQIFSDQQLANKVKQSLHSIDWITGEQPLPDDDKQLTAEQKMGLILKAVDTLGKMSLNQRGDFELRHPEIFFGGDDGYHQWLQYQIENKRFPLSVNGREITAEEYAKKDIQLTMRGIGIMSDVCGIGFCQHGNINEEQFNDLWFQTVREIDSLKTDNLLRRLAKKSAEN